MVAVLDISAEQQCEGSSPKAVVCVLVAELQASGMAMREKRQDWHEVCAITVSLSSS
jgi:hypothetical protein